MAATILLRRWTGPSGSIVKTDITGINTEHVTEDAHYTTGGTNPIPIPSAGTNYGFWVTVGLNAAISPAGTINNLRFYTDGVNSSPSGVTWLCQNANVGADSGYRTAAGTVGVTGTQLTTGNHSGLTGAPVDPFTFTAGSPLSLGGSIVNPNIGDFGDLVVTQLVVASSATATGVITTETMTYQWDET